MKFQTFDCQETSGPENTAAATRPVEKPRSADPAASYTAPSLELFDCGVSNIPEDTLAEPRPPGKERRLGKNRVAAAESASERTRTARARWLKVIYENMVPSEGGRLQLKTGRRSINGDRLKIVLREPVHASECGTEVGIQSAEFLLLYECSDKGKETVTYIPWEMIVYVTFIRDIPKV